MLSGLIAGMCHTTVGFARVAGGAHRVPQRDGWRRVQQMTGRREKLRISAFTLGAVLVLAGCSNVGDGETSPTRTSHIAQTSTGSGPISASINASAPWDPCTLPDSAISAAGLNPTSKEKDVVGVGFDGWKVCSWRADAKWYDFSILSGQQVTLEDVRKRPDYGGFAPRSVGTHQGIQFRDVGDSDNLECYIAIGLPQGVAMFKVLTRYGVPGAGDPCGEVGRVTDGLAQNLPRS